MKFIRLIDDSSLWKEEFEKNAKGKGKAEGNFFVVNKTNKENHVEYLPEVKEDIIMAKAKIASRPRKRYKRKGRVVKNQSKRKGQRGKKVLKRKKTKPKRKQSKIKRKK